MLTDCHAHLNDDRLIEQTDDIIEKLKEYDVGRVICASFDRKSSLVSVDLADKYDVVYSTIAVHPHDSVYYTEEDAILFKELAKHPKVLAIGETGLDFHYNWSPQEKQKEVFIKHLEIADEVGLPVVLHLRSAHYQGADILKEYKSLLNHGVMIHSFCEHLETLKKFDSFDCYFSVGGSITYPKNLGYIEDVLKIIDRSRLVFETDCPYLTPVPYRGRLNYPYFVKYVAMKCAEILQCDYDELCVRVEENVERFFFKIKKNKTKVE